MRIVVLLLFFCSFLACSKKEKVGEDSPIVGTWQLIELRADPGDGSGKFRPVSTEVTLTFAADGQYSDSRDQFFNRYELITPDTVKLYRSYTEPVRLLAIQELSGSTLTFYTGWPWCGGPYGERFVRADK